MFSWLEKNPFFFAVAVFVVIAYAGIVEVLPNFAERLKSLEGIIYIDNDLDLQNELVVTYERGRAQYIKYDKNNDGVIDLYAMCDFGAPLSLAFADSKIDLFYSDFPCVSKVVDNSNGSVYQFLNYDYYYNPFEMIIDSAFSSFNVSFYIPIVDTEIEFPDEYILAKHASTVELVTNEREKSKVIYTVYDGRPVFAVFYTGDYKYAYSTIEPGYPFVRYVDYDNDEIYETAETYDVDVEEKYKNPNDIELIKKIFGKNTFSEDLYLKSVEIDRNCDTIIEFSEQYLGYNGKVSSWDADGNGVIDYEYIRYPDSDDNILIEETIIYKTNGLEYVLLKNENSIPVLMKYEGSDVEIIKGEKENYYWIEQKGTVAQEEKLFSEIKDSITDGLIKDLETYLLSDAPTKSDKERKAKFRDSILGKLDLITNPEFKEEALKILFRTHQEMYIPIPDSKDFHKNNSNFFVKNESLINERPMMGVPIYLTKTCDYKKSKN